MDHTNQNVYHIHHTPENLTDHISFSNQGKCPLTQTSISFQEISTTVTKKETTAKAKEKLTADGMVSYYDQVKEVSGGNSYKITVTFAYEGTPLITGLGQFEDGVFDYRGKTEYLYHSNMRCPLPVFYFSEGYGILLHSESDVIFRDEKGQFSLEIGAGNCLSYDVIFGDTLDDIIKEIRHQTGQASLLPRWAFGYWQSKERYESSAELEAVVSEFRQREIPLDCIVQDWRSWEGDKWGQKTTDKERFPDLKASVSALHENHCQLLWSVWPRFGETAEDYKAFSQADLMMGASMYYNPYEPEGRKLYGEQSNVELLPSGIDGFWCDCTEPFGGVDWNGAERLPEALRFQNVREEFRQHIPWDKVNSYPLYHAQGVYENFRQQCPEKRLVNLSRSIHTGGQQYGVVLWSGDTAARWEVLTQQIAEGLKVGLCGMPYWTLDIGAFFTVKDDYEKRGCNCQRKIPLWFWNGGYNEGCDDLGYVELYTRWFQFGTFLPIFRSHGTDTPREPWRFHNDTFSCYDVICDFIALRYRLLPYIYSLAGEVHFSQSTMMRSFLFDFPQDEKAISCATAYLFGKAFLVAPVTRPMYYLPDSEKIQEFDDLVEVYLPKGCLWYDYFTKEVYQGGQTVSLHCPIEKMPLFVKAGAIIPLCTKKIQHTEEQGGQYDCIEIYQGGNGDFTYYHDQGDGFAYEKGEYTTYALHYEEEKKTLHFGQSNRPVNQECILRYIQTDGKIQETKGHYYGEPLCISLLKENKNA